jgi:glycosyltransferase involved in cell wall biosynthesis
MLVDNSLSIVNRTGAYYIARDLCQAFAPSARVRHWRLGAWAPEGLARKLAARMMLAELAFFGDSERFLIRDGGRGPRLFLDPLYVLRSRLDAADTVLCHDVGPLTHPRLYDPRTVGNYRRAYAKLRRARPGMVFVSDWSKARFVELLGSGFRHLATIPLYVRGELAAGPTAPIAGVGSRFFLTVGAFETRKNHAAALDAYRAGGFAARGIDYVLCGARGDAFAAVAADAAATPGVRLLGYVPDAGLRWLYDRAEAFVLPSHLEGFGMPALEAASRGLLPIVTEESALVEAVGGLCLPVPPDDPAAIAAAMSAALARPEAERRAIATRLRAMAAAATRERFLARWSALMLPADRAAPF